MKKTILILSTALFFLSACGSLAPIQSMDASVNIHVECRDDTGTRGMVVMLLKRARALDIRQTALFGTADMQASYYVADASPGKLEEIADLLQNTPGVLFVEIVRNQNMIRQAR